MSSAAAEAYGVAMSDTTSTTKPNLAVDNSLADKLSDKQWLVKLLIDAGLKGERSDFHMLAQRFHAQPHTLRLIAAYLKRWYAGRLSGLDAITGLTECRDEDALNLVLNAFENKLRGASDLTLLYLLSLSDLPVPQQHMKSVFRSTLMERWLTRRDDYVRFLGPLGRLNTEHWQWVIENLRRLQLLEQPIPGQHDLLFVEEPIRQYFRHNLRTHNKHVFEQATQDMEKLFQDTVVEFRQRYRSTPEIKTFISPELTAELELEEPKPDPLAALWKSPELDKAEDHLQALRNSLGTLKASTERLAAQLRENYCVSEHESEQSNRENNDKNNSKIVAAQQQKIDGAKGSDNTHAVAKAANRQLQKLTLPHTARQQPQHSDKHYRTAASAKKPAMQKLTLPHTARNHQP